jgi:hypothetical protein
MKKLIFALTTIAALSIPTKVLAVPTWFGMTNWNLVSACIYDGPTRARLTPAFPEDNSNIRALFATDSCGIVQYQHGGPIYENGFYLIKFYVPDLGEWRKYWIHTSQLDFYY